MAKKITPDQVIEKNLWQNTIDSTKLLIEVVDKLDVSLKKVATDSKAALKGNSTQDFAGLKGADEEVKKVNKAFEDKIKLDKQRLVLEKQLEKARLSELKLQKDREKAFDRADKQEKIAIKNAQKLRKANIDSTNAYKKLTKQVNNAQARFKRLAAEFGVNSKQAQKANITFAQLDDRLRRINNTAKDGRRDVGRYGLAFREVGISLKSLFLAGGVVGVIRGIGAAFGDAFERVRSFDKELQNIAGVSGIARKDLESLEKLIISVSGSSIKTSNEVAKLASTLFTLGNSEKAVKLLLKPINDLGIALNTTSEEAADFLGQTLNAFGKGAESGQEFADIIANVRVSTSLDFQRIKDALGFVAPTANALGLSLGEVSAQIGILQDNGIRSSRAGRLLSTSFLRLADSGISLETALDKINDAQDRGVDKLELLRITGGLFGKESAALGLVLADNRDRTAELADEFDNLSEGSLKTLTDSQLDSLDAKLKIVDSSWESLILSIENGRGPISNFFKDAADGLSNFLNQLKRINQSFSDNLTEDLSKRNEDFIANLKSTIKDNISLKESELEQEIKIQESRFTRGLMSEIELNDKKKSLTESFDEFKDGARNEQLKREKQFLEDTINEQIKGSSLTVDNAEKELERLKKISDTPIDVSRASKVNEQREKLRIAQSKTSIAQSVVINKDKIRLINLLLEEGEKVEINTNLTDGNSDSKKSNTDATKELTGLINLQSKAVSDLNTQIREAKTEDDILGLSKKADIAKEELDRLNRIVTSTLEEAQKIELDLIEDTTEKRIAKEKEKSKKIIEQLTTNSRLEEDKKNELIVQETERFENFELNEAIKLNKKRIKQEAEFSKAEFEQRRTGFKTEEAFEKEKAAQFEAIKKNQLQAELDLLEFSGRKEDELRIEQLKAQLQGFHKLGEDKIKVEIDVVEILQALNDKYFDEKLVKADEEIDSTKRRGEQLENLAAQGNANAAASLGQNQKDQAEANKKKEELLQKEKQFELALAVIAAFNTALDQPGATTGSALTEAITSTTVLTSFVASLPSFFDGTTDTGSNGSLDSNGGHMAMLHDNERVVDKQNNNKMGGISNDDAANIVHDFNNDLLSYNTPQLIVKEDRFDSSEKILSKFDTLEKSIVSAINNKETYLGSDIDTMKKLIYQNYSKDGTRTKVKSKLRIRQ